MGWYQIGITRIGEPTVWSMLYAQYPIVNDYVSLLERKFMDARVKAQIALYAWDPQEQRWAQRYIGTTGA
jgi:hypothetical protein